MALIIFLFITSVSAQCLEEDNCEKIDFPNAQDEIRMKRNYSLQSHFLSEHTSSDYYGCFTRCTINCQCLSFNFKSDSGVGSNCQLNEAASYTDPESIKPRIGWTYIEMVRSYLKKVNFDFYNKWTVLARRRAMSSKSWQQLILFKLWSKKKIGMGFVRS